MFISFFFFKQKTAYELRISDWSSDVCSSDLQHLVAHQRPDNRPGLVGEHAPVGAELVAHDDAGDHAHAEGHSKDDLPVLEDRDVAPVARPQPEPLEHREVAGKADGERSEEHTSELPSLMRRSYAVFC